MRSRRAFTITELLVAMTILVILAAVLFPVFQSARASVDRSSCASRMKQVFLAVTLYQNEYDDGYPMVGYQVNRSPDSATQDRLWPQLLLPYLKDSRLWACPADKSERPRPDTRFNADLSLADSNSRFYAVAERANLGYNSYNLSPVVRNGSTMFFSPVKASQVGAPANTIGWVETVWEVRGGATFGGGNYVAEPPCRYVRANATFVDTIPGAGPAGRDNGWLVDPEEESVNETTFGGAWGWHGGKLHMLTLDGRAVLIEPNRLANGCRVESNWAGAIFDQQTYLWDLQ